MTRTFSSAQTGLLRLRNLRVLGPRCQNAAEVARTIGAIQAQDANQSLWAIGVRLESGTRSDVDRAIAKAEIVRTWPMRGTIHFVAAETARWQVELGSVRAIAQAEGRAKQLSLDGPTIENAMRVFANALKGRALLRRDQLLTSLGAAGISIEGERGNHLVRRAGMNGLLCIGPRVGAEQTYASMQDWLPTSKPSPDDPLAALAQRYCASHGPATPNDFAWWSGSTVTEAKRVFAKIDTGQGPSKRTDNDDELLLLPGFDEFLLGYQDRSAVLDDAFADQICPGGNGVFRPMIVWQGRIVGTWQSGPKRGGLEITLRPFEGSAAHKKLLKKKAEAAALRFASFWEKELQALIVAS